MAHGEDAGWEPLQRLVDVGNLGQQALAEISHTVFRGTLRRAHLGTEPEEVTYGGADSHEEVVLGLAHSKTADELVTGLSGEVFKKAL